MQTDTWKILQKKINPKADIEKIVGWREPVYTNSPSDYLYILRGVWEELDDLVNYGGIVSLAVLALPPKGMEIPGHVIWYEQKLEPVFEKQKPSMVLNAPILARERAQFRTNAFYSSYEICVISPIIGLDEFLKSRRLISPKERPYQN